VSRIIEQSVHIDAPVDAVWRTVTEPDLVRLWFADAVDVRASPGQEGSMTFGTDPSSATTVHVSVQAVDPPRRLAYRWQHPAGSTAAPGNSTLVEFTLEAEGDGTRLRVAESGLDELPWSDDRKSSFESDHTEGWAGHLARLAEAATQQEHVRP
jgi:uncharacterized protein YndB with AHSA1/START domain